MAMAERILNARFGDDLVNHKTFVICGDGCLSEGIGQEAISIAGHYRLKNLIVLFDDNEITIDGPTSLSTSEDHVKRFMAAGWNATRVNGHDTNEVQAAIEEAMVSDKPTMIACRTQIGHGSPAVAGSSKAHGSPLGAAEAEATRKALNWNHTPFEVPENIIETWRSFADRNRIDWDEWQKAFAEKGRELNAYLSQEYLKDISEHLLKMKKDALANPVSEASRVSSGKVIELLNAKVRNLIGGSADLSGSNNTQTKSHIVINKDYYGGDYINYGVREHAMAAMMNGISLHGALLPYSGTFLSFTDYARPAMRLAALMEQGIVYIMTHDSIGLGEDGPTHQPIEHLASFRAMPNMHVFRPADLVETIECWDIALQTRNTPSILALSRQKLPQVRIGKEDDSNKSALGAYVLKEFENDFKVTIFATGSEVHIALEAAVILESNMIGTRVISVPCMDLFFEQEAEYTMSLLCNNTLKVGIEAASSFGWERMIGSHGMFFGIDTFGHSAPAEDLYKHFGLTAENVSSRVIKLIGA
jgi:transketolase